MPYYALLQRMVSRGGRTIRIRCRDPRREEWCYHVPVTVCCNKR